MMKDVLDSLKEQKRKVEKEIDEQSLFEIKTDVVNKTSIASFASKKPSFHTMANYKDEVKILGKKYGKV